MPVEFIGFVGNQNASETIPRQGSVLDLNYVETLAKVQENGGFDRVLLAFHSTSPECLLVAQHAARRKFIVRAARWVLPVPSAWWRERASPFPASRRSIQRTFRSAAQPRVARRRRMAN
jgi:hypothetical protein